MKKLIAIILTFVFVLSLVACGKESTPTNEDISKNDVVTEKTTDNSSASNSETENESSSDNTEWKQFLKDYEAWVDDYIEISKKYKSDPTDISISSDYTQMVSEAADWQKRADEIELELEDTNDALEYSEELLRITEKLSKIEN